MFFHPIICVFMQIVLLFINYELFHVFSWGEMIIFNRVLDLIFFSAISPKCHQCRNYIEVHGELALKMQKEQSFLIACNVCHTLVSKSQAWKYPPPPNQKWYFKIWYVKILCYYIFTQLIRLLPMNVCIYFFHQTILITLIQSNNIFYNLLHRTYIQELYWQFLHSLKNRLVNIQQFCSGVSLPCNMAFFIILVLPMSCNMKCEINTCTLVALLFMELFQITVFVHLHMNFGFYLPLKLYLFMTKFVLGWKCKMEWSDSLTHSFCLLSMLKLFLKDEQKMIIIAYHFSYLPQWYVTSQRSAATSSTKGM